VFLLFGVWVVALYICDICGFACWLVYCNTDFPVRLVLSLLAFGFGVYAAWFNLVILGLLILLVFAWCICLFSGDLGVCCWV